MGDKKHQSKEPAPGKDAGPEKLANGNAPVENSYEDAMQARIDRLAHRAKNTRRRSFYTTLIVFFVLCFVGAGVLLLSKSCEAGKRFTGSFSWLHGRRR
ncbi:MAG TPA: hypothetical protein PLQ35_11230 [bacterium]|nr:hypothetical protein [bacterium]HQL62854.1 hypothetical protein [bacterium]